MSPPKTINSPLMKQMNKEISALKKEINALIRTITPKTRASIKKKSKKK